MWNGRGRGAKPASTSARENGEPCRTGAPRLAIWAALRLSFIYPLDFPRKIIFFSLSCSHFWCDSKLESKEDHVILCPAQIHLKGYHGRGVGCNSTGVLCVRFEKSLGVCTDYEELVWQWSGLIFRVHHSRCHLPGSEHALFIVVSFPMVPPNLREIRP